MVAGGTCDDSAGWFVRPTVIKTDDPDFRLLRDELGFDGTVVSDYWAVAFLKSKHGVAETMADAGRLALHAGIDVELPDIAAKIPGVGRRATAENESITIDMVLCVAIWR